MPGLRELTDSRMLSALYAQQVHEACQAGQAINWEGVKIIELQFAVIALGFGGMAFWTRSLEKSFHKSL